MTFAKETGAFMGRSCGRMQALVVLHRMLTQSENKQLLARTLAAEFRANPAKFRKLVAGHSAQRSGRALCRCRRINQAYRDENNAKLS